MDKGDLYESAGIRGEGKLVQIVRTWNKRDIDPECLESVAIVPMVQVIVWQGGRVGTTAIFERRYFTAEYVKIKETEYGTKERHLGVVNEAR